METEGHILHVDMDAFYASVEVRDNPALAGKPVLVGASPEQRGVVAACSYEARRFGIHSAMPMRQAIRLCPQAVVLPVRMSRYVDASRQIRQIFHSFTPDVEPLSLDEAFLDVSGCLSLFGNAETIGRKIKQAIKTQTGLTASVGVAPNKFLAKLASDLGKPDGFFVITRQNKQQILDPLPVWRIWGIGKVTSQNLENNNIHTVLQFRTAARSTLSAILGNHVDDLLKLACGNDDRKVDPDSEAKSLSVEQTFPKDIGDKAVLMGVLTHHVEEVSQRLRAETLQCKTITLKLRSGDFKTITRSVTMERPTQTTHVLMQEASRLFNQWHRQSGVPLRLLGFGTTGLSPAGSGQQLLFADPEEDKQKMLDTAFDKIRGKYGDNSLKRGG